MPTSTTPKQPGTKPGKPVGLAVMALRNIGRRPRRSVLSALAIGITAIAMVTLMAMITGMVQDMGATLRTNFTGDIVVQHPDYERAATKRPDLVVNGLQALQAGLDRVAGVDRSAARITGGASVFVDGEAVFFPFYGIQAQRDPTPFAAKLEPGGRLPAAGAREALITRALADQLGLKAGDSLTAITQTLRGSSNGISFTITGIIGKGLEQYAGPWLFMDLGTAQRFIKLADGATTVLTMLKPQADRATVLKEVNALLAAGGDGSRQLVARQWDKTSLTYGLLSLLNVVYAFIEIFFFALASTVMINTMLMVVLERSREIGTLAAMGMDRPAIIRLFLAESAILAGIGAAAGAILGSGLTLVLHRIGLDYTEALQGVSIEISPIIRPVLEWQNPCIVFVLAVAVSLLFTLLPVKRINKMSIVASLRGD